LYVPSDNIYSMRNFYAILYTIKVEQIEGGRRNTKLDAEQCRRKAIGAHDDEKCGLHD
jgi:hypothetical protein